MSISQELMYAILSMDSYNRGYNTGIAGLSEASDGSVQIGTATVSYNLEDAQLSNAAQAAGCVYMEWRDDHGVPAPKAVAQALGKKLKASVFKDNT